MCAQQHTYRVLVNDHWEERSLKKGSFKELPNNVQTVEGNIHHYCPVEQVFQQLQFMVDQTRQEEFLNASGVSQAAYVHHTFTQIHPFSDGNGRVARALASIFLYREYSLPMVVFDDQRSEYFDALEAADAGDSSTFVEFMGTLVDSTIEMMEISVIKALRPSIAEQTAKLSSSLKVV